MRAAGRNSLPLRQSRDKILAWTKSPAAMGRDQCGAQLLVRWLLQQHTSPLMRKGKQNDVDVAFDMLTRMVVWVRACQDAATFNEVFHMITASCPAATQVVLERSQGLGTKPNPDTSMTVAERLVVVNAPVASGRTTKLSRMKAVGTLRHSLDKCIEVGTGSKPLMPSALVTWDCRYSPNRNPVKCRVDSSSDTGMICDEAIGSRLVPFYMILPRLLLCKQLGHVTDVGVGF
jgi:hypothetical protein